MAATLDSQQLPHQSKENSNGDTTAVKTDYKWWLRVGTYIIFLLAGQTTAVLLGRLYYDKGGNSTWMATLVQSAGFPAIIPLFIYITEKPNSSPTNLSLPKRILLYLAFGLATAGDNMMYSYGLLYIPVSTYSLLCATQLAFNAVFSFFFNSQKFTILIFNSLVLLTISAALLAINSGSDDGTTTTKAKYAIGFMCTVGASATYSLYLSLMQLTFEKVLKKETFKTLLEMIIYPSFVATCATIVGLFVSGDWKWLHQEMGRYQEGRVSYVMTLSWTALSWQVSIVGMLGLIVEVSSLFSNVISTLALPLVPVLAVVFFHDRMNGVKVIALLLAVWGFLSYIYQHYLDDAKAKRKTAMEIKDSAAALQQC